MKRRSKKEWERIALLCEVAYHETSKYSLMRLIFKFGTWYARRKSKRAE